VVKIKEAKVQDGVCPLLSLDHPGPAAMTKYSNSTWARFGNIA